MFGQKSSIYYHHQKFSAGLAGDCLSDHQHKRNRIDINRGFDPAHPSARGAEPETALNVFTIAHPGVFPLLAGQISLRRIRRRLQKTAAAVHQPRPPDNFLTSVVY